MRRGELIFLRRKWEITLAGNRVGNYVRRQLRWEGLYDGTESKILRLGGRMYKIPVQLPKFPCDGIFVVGMTLCEREWHQAVWSVRCMQSYIVLWRVSANGQLNSVAPQTFPRNFRFVFDRLL